MLDVYIPKKDEMEYIKSRYVEQQIIWKNPKGDGYTAHDTDWHKRVERSLKRFIKEEFPDEDYDFHIILERKG